MENKLLYLLLFFFAVFLAFVFPYQLLAPPLAAEYLSIIKL